jgi:hypothetical protein
MVWEVLVSSKGVWKAYGIRAKGEEEAPNNKNIFFLEIHKKGGGGVERHWDEAKR